MVNTREFVRSELKELSLFLLASIAQAYFMCGRCNDVKSYSLVIGFTFLMWIFLWKGNSILTNYVSCKISWMDFPLKRFFVGLLTTVVYTLLAILFLIFVFENFLGFNFGGSYRFTIATAVSLTLVVSLFLHCREFLSFWRKASFESARFQRESISARYETLKSQVNPAFLFHSLKTLSGLVYDDEHKAVKYIKQLSDVYRYILDTRDKEVVSIVEELKFLASYKYLLQARYGSVLNFEINLAEREAFLPPLALHMMIESALHNMSFGEDRPMNIAIQDDGQFVSFEVNCLFRDSETNKVHDSVIDKIAARYRFLSTAEVDVRKTSDSCRVLLPVLVTS